MTGSMFALVCDESKRLSPRHATGFDYVSEGARHGLDEAAARALWERALRNATDVLGRGDVNEAQRLFHRLAERLAPRP